MRISFCGSSGTGKSTLANFLHEKYGWPICPVGSRSVAAAMGFASPYDVDAAGKRAEFQRCLFEEKRDWENAHDDFITDRTHLDNLVYSSMHGAAATVDLNAYLMAMKRYHVVFFCDVRQFQKTGDDPQRVHDKTYHLIYDCLLRGLIRDYFEEDKDWIAPRITHMLWPREASIVLAIEDYEL